MNSDSPIRPTLLTRAISFALFFVLLGLWELRGPLFQRSGLRDPEAFVRHGCAL